MSKTSDNKQPQVIHPPYEYAITLVVIQQDNAVEQKDSIDALWGFESVGEAVHLTLEDAEASSIPLPDQTDVFPIVLVYDRDVEEDYADPVYTSSDIEEVCTFIKNFESNYTTN